MKFMSVFSMLNASDAGGFAMVAVLSALGLAALCAGGYALTARREAPASAGHPTTNQGK